MLYAESFKAARLKALFVLALPIAFSRMSTMLMGFTDALMLSNYSNNELPYVLNAWLPVGIAFSLGLGILQGVQVITSELVGAGKPQETGRIIRRGLVAALLIGFVTMVLVIVLSPALFGLFGFSGALKSGTLSAANILSYGLVGHMVCMACMLYLEALHKQKLVTSILLVGVVVNFGLDLILVKGMYGFAPMGADGVAWATTVSRYIIVAGLLAAVLFMTPVLKRMGVPPLGEFKRQFTVGLGATLSNVAEFSAFNLTFVIATLVSLEAASAYGLAIHVGGLAYMVFLGLATATSVQVAEGYGRKDYAEVVAASRSGVVLCLGVGVIFTVALMAFNDSLAAMFYAFAPDKGDAPIALFAGLLGVTSLFILGDALQVVSAYALRAMDIIWLPSFIHLGSYYLIMLPVAYYAGIPMGYGAYGIMWGVVSGCVVAGGLQTLVLEAANRRRNQTI